MHAPGILLVAQTYINFEVCRLEEIYGIEENSTSQNMLPTDAHLQELYGHTNYCRQSLHVAHRLHTRDCSELSKKYCDSHSTMWISYAALAQKIVLHANQSGKAELCYSHTSFRGMYCIQIQIVVVIILLLQTLPFYPQLQITNTEPHIFFESNLFKKLVNGADMVYTNGVFRNIRLQ